jgi:hypothetical protein
MMEATGNFVARVFPNRGLFAGETMIVARWFYDRDAMLLRTKDHDMIALPYIYTHLTNFSHFSFPLLKTLPKISSHSSSTPQIHP